MVAGWWSGRAGGSWWRCVVEGRGALHSPWRSARGPMGPGHALGEGALLHTTHSPCWYRNQTQIFSLGWEIQCLVFGGDRGAPPERERESGVCSWAGLVEGGGAGGGAAQVGSWWRRCRREGAAHAARHTPRRVGATFASIFWAIVKSTKLYEGMGRWNGDGGVASSFDGLCAATRGGGRDTQRGNGCQQRSCAAAGPASNVMRRGGWSPHAA